MARSTSSPMAQVSTCAGKPAWFCIRSHLEPEHNAAAHLALIPEAEVFKPRLRPLRSTHRGRPAANVRVLPCGVDLVRFKPIDPGSCQRQLEWNDNLFHVLFASSNGDPVNRPWLAQAAVAEALLHRVPAKLHFLTGVPNSEVPVWLNASDVLLLTSLHEGYPAIVEEALACELPIVSVDVGDVAERIEKIAGCYLAKPDPVDLACALSHVWDDGCRLACRPGLEGLSVLSVAKRPKDFYELVCGNEPAAASLLRNSQARCA